MTEPKQSLEEILFDLALQKPAAADRAAFLDSVGRDNPGMRAQLEDLLKAHFGGAGFLPKHAAVDAQGPEPMTLLASPAEAPAQMLGRYKLLEKLGEGGFGEVWMAEQREPVKRRVALKIIKLGMDSRQIVARFEAERQALAMMDHANIAKIFDADVTDTGRPYFVMELVRGIKITEYCDQNQLPTRERLDLFIKVCQAIQHAHQKGIIHRDIKPSNILVTLHDGVPVPKVIDFGIAKATQGELTDKTVFTQFQQFIGTPAYISPEQAEMSGLDIDTRADIYSLGVLLYELLVGQTPFDAREMMKGGLDALRKVIREQEAPRPSTKLKTLLGDDLTSTAQRRHTDPAHLSHQLQGDLDWIVMKCLEKDRTRRYDTANGLAMDLQRHLSNEPVVARPPSTAYKIQKSWQRNKLVFTAGAAIAVALVVGITISTWQAVRATRAKEAETRQRLAADSSREQALAAQQLAESARANEVEMRRSAEARAYAGDMNLAQQALAADNLGLVTELLDRHRPQPGQTDRRGWEWRFLWQHSRSDALFTLGQESNGISGLVVSHDGKWLAVQANGVSVWNLASRREVMRVPGQFGGIAFSPVRPLLAMWGDGSPGSRFRFRFWDAETGQFVPDPPSPDPSASKRLRGMAFNSDGQTLVTASVEWSADPNEFTRWRLEDGKKLATYPVKIRGPGVGMPVSKAGGTNLVALAEEDRWIRVIDADSGSEQFKTQAPGKGWLEAVALSADGRTLAACSGTDETVVRLWDVPSGRELGILEGHRAYVIALVFWPDGKTLATAGADQTIRLWDVAEKRPFAVLRGHRDEIHRLALLPDNSTLISGAKDGTIMVWDTSAVRRKKSITTLPSKGFGFWELARDGGSIITLAGQGWLTRWGGPDFQQQEPLFQVNPNVQGVCLSSDQRLLATGDGTGTVALWDVPERKLLREMRLSTGPISPCAFVSGGTALAVWNESGKSLAIHDVGTGHQISSWPDSKLVSGPRVISPDGRWCLTGGGNEPGLLRELATGREIGPAPAPIFEQAAFSPDGRQLAIPFPSGIVRLWDLPALTETRAPFKGFLRAAHSVAFSPDGRRLAVGSAAEESLKIWDLESGLPMLTLPGEGGPCWATAFSRDGNTLATRHELGTLDVWRVPSWEEIAAAEAKEKTGSKQP